MNFVVLRIHMLHILFHVAVYMYEGCLKSIQHLYLHGSVTRLYGIVFNIG